MADFDLFNGDADGIFSLLQLRQIEPRPNAERITGVKRDIKLFSRIAGRAGPGDRVTALDISMAKNTAGLTQVLKDGADVFYVDHHQTGAVPQSDRLTVITDDAKETCTAYLIDQHLRGAKAAWAVCGAYGDNFQTLADAITTSRGLDLPMGRLRELGELVNYNAYGLTVEDLHIHPAALFDILLGYDDPVEFLDDAHPIFETLQSGHRADWNVAQSAREIDVSEAGQILSLPSGAASNRIGGLFGNALVDEEPDHGFAVLTELEDGTSYRVSIRAPRGRSSGAAVDIATQFGGGGRAAAAGIDALSEADLARFIDTFRTGFAA
ncbi:acetyltransferase [Algimonas arctica]|uniref:Acetyltransferase n=1 Tax=Algimonas arctica TaxID=1479486 RepID=A0A8J3G2Y5_9PROT|nr:DHH family phosphoesterase [Algimonas arctica]GHA99625.1 acetyltransferase [Algimonas arctica]